MVKTGTLAAAVALFVCLICPILMASEYSVIRTGGSKFDLTGKDGGVATMAIMWYRPNYAWMGTPRPTVEKGAQTVFRYRGKVPSWDLGVQAKGNQFVLDATLTSKTNFALTYAAIAITPSGSINGGKVVYRHADGSTSSAKIPISPANPTNVVGFSFVNKDGKRVVDFKLAKAAELHSHVSVRVKIADKAINANETRSNTFTASFDGDVSFYASSRDFPNQTKHDNWFAFQPQNKHKSSAIGMEDWLSVPKKRVSLNGGRVMRDGRPWKVWGTNVEYSATAPRQADADERADFFAKHGVNSVRLHKLTNPGWEGLGSRTGASVYDPASLNRFDYFTNALRTRGICYGLSPIWDLKIFDGDRDKLAAYDEIRRKGNTKGLVWFAKDVQDLHIETLVNLVGHKSKHSGMRYADDPAVTYVEIQNEEDFFFYTSMPEIRKCPTYQRMLAKLFSDWLRKKYGSHAGLTTAWGGSAINTFSTGEGALSGEHLDKGNIMPVGNPWLWDNQGKTGHRAKRLQDTGLFMYECQRNYYSRAKKALAKIGYDGPLVGSNWQAGSKTGHFLNLISDAELGFVDRHNYFGGSKGAPAHQMLTGHKLSNVTTLVDPCGGLLSVGMQQVKGAPFMFSEWEAVLPVEWAAADTTLVAAYGFGLQDWDVSYHFASNASRYTRELAPGRKKFNNLVPVGFGLYPVLSRMVQRGDVKPGKIIATRRITVEQACKQDYDFENTTVQSHDFKSFTGTPSHNAMAAGRVLIEFVKEPRSSTITDWRAAYKRGNTIVSSTGQLSWTTNGKRRGSYVTINTSGTQGVVGFSPGESFKMNDMKVTTKSPYSVILATAKSMNKTMKTDKQVIVVAMARCHNTGMNMSETMIFDVGRGPMILEPVQADLQFRRANGRVTILDHDGHKTNRTYILENGKFELDTGRDKTMYYLVEFE